MASEVVGVENLEVKAGLEAEVDIEAEPGEDTESMG